MNIILANLYFVNILKLWSLLLSFLYIYRYICKFKCLEKYRCVSFFILRGELYSYFVIHIFQSYYSFSTH